MVLSFHPDIQNKPKEKETQWDCYDITAAQEDLGEEGVQET